MSEPHAYHHDLKLASPDHEACESRVEYLARQLAEQEEIIRTLRRQRDAAHLEPRVANEHLGLLTVTP